MKKFTTKLLTLFLILLLTASVFTSCFKDEPKIEDLPEEERAAAVFAKADEKMEKTKSYRAEEKISFDFTLNKQDFLIEYLSTVYVTDRNTENYAETNETEYNFYLNGTKKESSTTTEGFRDGIMFLSSVEGIHKSSLKSELTLEEYENHVEDMAQYNDTPDFEKFFSGAKTKTAEKQEDGSWVAVFSGPSDESIENFSEFFEILTSVLGADVEITDISCELTVTSLFLVDKLEFTVLLDSASIGGTTPLSASKINSSDTAITISVEYFDYDTAEQPNNIQLDKYTDVPDLRKLYEIENSLGELIDKENGSFSSDIKHEVKFFNDTQIYREKDVCEYKNDADGFSYELYNESEGENYIISYDNGKQTVTYVDEGVERELQKTDSTDFEQRFFIEGLLNEGDFSISNVANFTATEKRGNFIYEFESAKPNEEIVDSIVNSMNATDYTGAETITVELDADGNIVKYTYEVSLDLELKSGSKATYEIEVKCAYGTILSDVQ